MCDVLFDFLSRRGARTENLVDERSFKKFTKNEKKDLFEKIHIVHTTLRRHTSHTQKVGYN